MRTKVKLINRLMSADPIGSWMDGESNSESGEATASTSRVQ